MANDNLQSDAKKTSAVVFVLVCLAAYVFLLAYPFYFIFVTKTFWGNTPQGKFFMTIVAGNGEPSNLIGLLLVIITALISGVSVMRLSAVDKWGWKWIALALCIAGIFSAVGLWYCLSGDAATNLWQPRRVEGVEDAQKFTAALHAYLSGAWKGLAILVGLLLGIKFKVEGES